MIDGAKTILPLLGFGAIILLVAILLRHQLEGFHQFVQRLPKWHLGFLAFFFIMFILYGGSKTNSAAFPPPSTNLLSLIRLHQYPLLIPTVTEEDLARGWQVWAVRTNETSFIRPSNAVIDEDWFRFGGHSMFNFVNFGGGWTFPYGTQELSRVTVMEDGGLRVQLAQKENEIRAVPCSLAAVPSQSYFWHTTNGDDRVFTWQEFFTGGDTASVINAQIELRNNGDFVTRSNRVETFCRYIAPFDFDGDGLWNEGDVHPIFYDGDNYGQSEAWVRANFANAEEILSVGYAQWVDAQVGVGLENGLYKFTANFPEAPHRITLLTVGEYSVVVTNAGEYVFLLEKGLEYEFNTEPYDEMVEYSMRDDLAPLSPVFASLRSEGISGQWSRDGGWHWIEFSPFLGVGSCLWMPTLYGTPNFVHLGENDFPQRVEAVLSDCCRTNNISYHWRVFADDISISSTNERVAQVSIKTLPRWRTASMSVSVKVGNYTLESYCSFTYGEHSAPQTSLEISAPAALLLNSNVVDSAKIGQVDVSFFTDIVTNGMLKLYCTVGDEEYVRLIGNCMRAVTSDTSFSVDIEGIKTSEAIDDVTLYAEFEPSNGGPPLTVQSALTVVQVGNVRLPEAPNDGLVVLTGSPITLELDVLPSGAENLLSVIYNVRRLRGNGSYTDWEYAAGNYWSSDAVFTPFSGGIYQVQALVGVDWGGIDERYYVWEDYSDYNTYGSKVLGDLKAFGVVSYAWQKRLRDCAHSFLGSTAYLSTEALPAQYGFSDYPAGDLIFKCNVFVAHRIVQSGLPCPSTRGWVHSYPPLANDWANSSYAIGNWRVISNGAYPEPGFIAADPDPEASGHVGIVDFDGFGISAGMSNVNRRFDSCSASVVFRKLEE